MLSLPSIILALLSVIAAYRIAAFGTTVEDIKAWTSSQWRQVAGTPSYVCEAPRMKPHFLSYDPIMVYIEDFLTPHEAQHLKALALPHYHTSTITKDDPHASLHDQHVHPATRDSQTAWLLSPDPVVDCVRARAAAFQGFAPNASMDALAAVRYAGAGAGYRDHYDWDARAAPRRAVDRRTSFFAVLDATDVVGGATRFPEVKRTAWGSARKGPWCEWVDCGDADGAVAVRPVVGNALFWVNFGEDGTGHPATLHAGMPVLSGTKIGLNVWTYGRVGRLE